MPAPYTDQLPDRDAFLSEIRAKSAGVSDEILKERLRIAEIVWVLAQGGWVHPVALGRFTAQVCG